MISDEHVKQVFQNSWVGLAKHWVPNMTLYTQFFRGQLGLNWEDQHPGGCQRHASVFAKFNIIPKYCFNCYKVSIEPRTVVELFKLMVAFEKIQLPNDNTRKCMVETREQVSGTYKGFIYCRGIQEADEISNIIQKVVSEEISPNIHVSLKRGCSEYAIAYPEYAHIDQGIVAMQYKEEWRVYEDIADRSFAVNAKPSSWETPDDLGYTQRDAQAMIYWLMYAATIGDLSYLTLSGGSVPPLTNLQRRSAYYPVEDR